MNNTDSILLPIALGIIMFGIGLNLRFSNFKSVFVAPKAVLFGLFGQLILLPAIGFVIAWMYPMDAAYKLGLVLIAACPGGTASNLVTFMLKGRVELSVALTAFNSLLILISIPLILSGASEFFLEESKWVKVEFGRIFTEVLFTVILPVVTGMAINSRFHAITDKIRKPLRYILPAILLGVFAFVLFGSDGDGFGQLLENWKLLIPTVALNVLTMITGFKLSGMIGIRHRGSYTIAIEMGLQNSALAIFLANSVLQLKEAALIAVLYGSFSFFLTLGIAYFMQRRGEKEFSFLDLVD